MSGSGGGGGGLLGAAEGVHGGVHLTTENLRKESEWLKLMGMRLCRKRGEEERAEEDEQRS